MILTKSTDMTVNDFDWKGDYARLHSIPPVRDHRPLVGITGNYDNQLCTLAEGYYRSVLLAGGTPVVLPPYEDTTSLAGLLDRKRWYLWMSKIGCYESPCIVTGDTVTHDQIQA